MFGDATSAIGNGATSIFGDATSAVVGGGGSIVSAATSGAGSVIGAGTSGAASVASAASSGIVGGGQSAASAASSGAASVASGASSVAASEYLLANIILQADLNRCWKLRSGWSSRSPFVGSCCRSSCGCRRCCCRCGTSSLLSTSTTNANLALPIVSIAIKSKHTRPVLAKCTYRDTIHAKCIHMLK